MVSQQFILVDVIARFFILEYLSDEDRYIRGMQSKESSQEGEPRPRTRLGTRLQEF